MKKLVVLAVGLLVFTACNSAADRIEAPTEPASETMMEALPAISFESDFHDFGEIQEGEVVNYTFKFTNEGEGPLIISNAQGSCGCTVPQWPRQPIAPGATGEIKVSFKGTIPNLFAEDKGVVAEGFLKDKNFFSATKILAKHDENYMPPEVKEALGDK